MITMRRREFLAAPVALATPSSLAGVKALAFDVFGTVVDWRGSIVREGAKWGKAKGLNVDWGKFADRWRAGYAPAMDKVRKGTLPWMKLDALHRLILDELLPEFHIEGLTEAEKDHWNRVWHRLTPWPDAVAGLARLRKKFVLATLSNGNVSLLVEMAKAAGLPWDTVLSAELFHHYKPDREVYLGAADLLGCQPARAHDGGGPCQRSRGGASLRAADRLRSPAVGKRPRCQTRGRGGFASRSGGPRFRRIGCEVVIQIEFRCASSLFYYWPFPR